jgi:hypothetical protein
MPDLRNGTLALRQRGTLAVGVQAESGGQHAGRCRCGERLAERLVPGFDLRPVPAPPAVRREGSEVLPERFDARAQVAGLRPVPHDRITRTAPIVPTHWLRTRDRSARRRNQSAPSSAKNTSATSASSPSIGLP